MKEGSSNALNSRLLEEALRHANAGRGVFPLHNPGLTSGGIVACSCGKSDCKHPGKHPRTENGFKDATTDERKIRNWWKRWPSANIGCATGAPVGWVAIDIDPRHGGDATLASLEAQHGKLPVTITARTGGGGTHYLFAHPGARVKCRSIATGIDCKADGGYIVIEPSTHKSGGQYRWEDGRDPWSCQPAPMPNWLLKLVCAEAAPDCPVSAAPGKFGPGGRNSGLTSIAGRLRNTGISHEAILAALSKENSLRCDPPLEDSEVAQIAGSITRYAVADEWHTPIPLGSIIDYPEFPLNDVFPKSFAEHAAFVRGLATEFQIAVEAVAMPMLAIASAAISKRFEIEAWPGWLEPAPLWMLVLLPSGERKSAVFRRLTDPVAAWERRSAEILRPQIVTAKTRKQILERRLKDAHEALGKDRCQDDGEVFRLAQELDATEIPRPPTLMATDVTSEALVALMIENGERALIASPEGDALDVLMGRYDDKARPNMGAWLNAYSGDRMHFRRRGRPPELLERPALAVAMIVQPEAVRAMFADRSARGRGLLGRFLVAAPPSMVGRRAIRPPTVSPELEQIYTRTLMRLLELPWNSAGPQFVSLTAGAAKLMESLSQEVEHALGDADVLGDRKDWGGKLCGAILRIALVMHCLEQAAEGPTFRDPASLRLGEEVMRAAIAWHPFLAAQERLTVQSLGCNLTTRTAQRILAWVKSKQLSEFTVRECFSACRSSEIDSVDSVREGIDRLVDFGYVRPQSTHGDARSRGRPPSQKYEVNPLWNGQSRGGQIPNNSAHNSQNSNTDAPDPISANCARSNLEVEASRDAGGDVTSGHAETPLETISLD